MATPERPWSATRIVLLVCTALTGLVLAGLAWSYLAGILLFALNHVDIRLARIDSFTRAYRIYHLDPLQGRRMHGAALAAGIATVTALVATVMGWRHIRHPLRPLYGQAHFASRRDIVRTGLLGQDGIIVGRYRQKLLRYPGQQFVLLAAPTRSGKGVGVVVPNLLTYPHSVVVLDIKQENFALTAGYRKSIGHDVFLFNPFAADLATHCYNPLDELSPAPHLQVAEILGIAAALYPLSGKDPFWNEHARNLFLGIALYLCETPELPRTIGEMLRQSTGMGQSLRRHLADIQACRVAGARPLSMACRGALDRFLANSDATFSGILASFHAPLAVFASPLVDAATSTCDFHLSDLRKKRMTIYVGITPNHLVQARVIVNLLFSQLVEINTATLPSHDATLRYPCLLLMDEFTAIGKVELFAKAVAYMAGYNLRLLPIIQSLAQLEAVYGEHDARNFVTNHAMQILFAPRLQRDAESYSAMLGQISEPSISTSHTRSFKSAVAGSRTDRTALVRRPLMWPQELKEMGQDECIVLLENSAPIRARKIRYFDDPALLARIVAPPCIPRLELHDVTDTAGTAAHSAAHSAGSSAAVPCSPDPVHPQASAPAVTVHGSGQPAGRLEDILGLFCRGGRNDKP